MDGIIDKNNNPFIKDSWIEQGYSFTQDRQELDGFGMPQLGYNIFITLTYFLGTTILSGR
jgi:hypothetical protein